MRRPSSFLKGWLLFGAALLAPSAHADELPPRCGQDLQCQHHLDQGAVLDLAQRYEPALREFQAAYKRKADPRLAVNIGRTLHKLGRFAEALGWYRDAGRAAPADIALQRQLQEYTMQAKQNLPPAAPPAAPAPQVVLVERPGPSVLPPVAVAGAQSSATAINQNSINIQLHTAMDRRPPPYKRISLWLPLAGIVLTAGATGIAVALWPRPYQADSSIQWYQSTNAGLVSAGGAR